MVAVCSRNMEEHYTQLRNWLRIKLYEFLLLTLKDRVEIWQTFLPLRRRKSHFYKSHYKPIYSKYYVLHNTMALICDLCLTEQNEQNFETTSVNK
jgi:hypothetical protein